MTTRLPVLGGHSAGFGATTRTDGWWTGSLLTLLGLGAFVAYSTWAGLQGQYYYFEPYLSPMYSPVLFAKAHVHGGIPVSEAWFGAWPKWWPSFVPASPSILILVFPLSFRFTCYYYRKAYYRAFAGSPPGCAVGPLAQGRKYKGETGLLLIQNLHRIALYFALIFIVLLAHDAILAFRRDGELGFGVGTLILCINPILLSLYTFGCHSFRHLIGGGNDTMSCGQETTSYGTWKKVSWLNARHMQFAWASLFWVGFTDIYVRLVAMGAITDVNTWGN